MSLVKLILQRGAGAAIWSFGPPSIVQALCVASWMPVTDAGPRKAPHGSVAPPGPAPTPGGGRAAPAGSAAAPTASHVEAAVLAGWEGASNSLEHATAVCRLRGATQAVAVYLPTVGV